MNLSLSETPAGAAPARPRLFALISLLLALGTLALYWPITQQPFLQFDDEQYIVGNAHVTSGLSATNFVWAFTTSEQANWHPLTWLSHQLDCNLFGLNAGGHHLVNLLYHIANTLLLFVFLRSTTGALWRSAFVAALFAWHPLHVESVAWASERKDGLCAFFWLLTLLAYSGYARSATVAVSPPGSARCAALLYGAALFFCACALMSKPMAVTLPCVLLLLDLWPLNRMAAFQTPIVYPELTRCPPVSAARLLGEKVPFFGLAMAGSLATYFVQSGAGAVSAIAVRERLANAVLAYARYTAKLFWPTDLAIIYPHPRHWPLWLALGAVAVLLVWTFLCVYRWRKNPFLTVGWFWFLGVLVPTIGLIQVGAQAMADRYTYLPSIGLFIVVAWGMTEYCSARGGRRAEESVGCTTEREPLALGLPPSDGEREEAMPPQGCAARRELGIMLALIGTAALLGCVGATYHELRLWHDSITLFRHAIAVTTDNYAAENCLGKAYEKLGDPRALACYQLSVKTEPRFPYAQFNLAMALLERGQTAEAIQHLEIAGALEPRDADIQYDLGIYFSQHASYTNAVNSFSNSLSARPGFAPAELGLGGAQANLGRAVAAASHFREALRLDPKLLAAQTNLDRLLKEHPEVR